MIWEPEVAAGCRGKRRQRPRAAGALLLALIARVKIIGFYAAAFILGPTRAPIGRRPATATPPLAKTAQVRRRTRTEGRTPKCQPNLREPEPCALPPRRRRAGGGGDPKTVLVRGRGISTVAAATAYAAVWTLGVGRGGGGGAMRGKSET